MKNLISRLRSDKILLRGFLLSLVIEFVTIIFILLQYSKLPPFLPIFNQLPWGDQRFMETPGIFIPVVVFLIIFALNIIIATVTYSKNPLVARVVAATTLLVSVMQFIFVVRTILVIL